ncbi:hypothetical protein STIUS_v1c05370 [Spiroplasma sp. TIUS-1]|uniref:hypothetical protein n=1 Tax=Spiroplasma sp. TIUS-1 TaxID=216963 RepID=UPI0013974351|nr:hypothetical protein [Spiroplasma sp. TIUS-1]QHX36091.1 hypothetical protein STIUS_v1c05370 [Spiroplasma sp. TIUS-1]
MKKENKYKKLKQDTMQLHKLELERKMELQKKSEINEGYREYKRISFFQWWDWLIIILLPWAIFGIILGIGFAIDNVKFMEYVLLLTGLAIIFCWIILSWRNNKSSAEYYNDSRKRYSKIYDAEHAMDRKIRIMTLTTGIIVALSSLIVFFAM